MKNTAKFNQYDNKRCTMFRKVSKSYIQHNFTKTCLNYVKYTAFYKGGDKTTNINRIWGKSGSLFNF